MNESENNLLRNIEAAVRNEAQALRRAGSAGPWCYMCGHEGSDLGACGCAFPEAFGCSRLKKLCANCRRAHCKVAAHLTQLFREKKLRVHRADSRRCRLFRFLRDALEAIAQKGDVQAGTLRHLLGANADPRADEYADFRRCVLEQFSRAKFLDFSRLAAELDEQERSYYIEKIAMSGIFSTL